MSQQETQTAERILIVDDEDLIVGAMRRYFQGLGYTVDSAYELE
jgi:CheY-like chemotaxis protein